MSAAADRLRKSLDMFERTPISLSSALALFALFVVLVKISRYGMRPKGLPPGPSTVPVLGNLLQMRLKDVHLLFDKWAKKYGEIVSVKLGGVTLILLNSPGVVRELIEKRSNYYSARPDLYIREIGGNRNIAFRDNDEGWRRQRKMYHLRLNTKIANQYVPYQLFDSTQLLFDIINTPERFPDHIARFTTSVASTVLYGKRTASPDQGYIKDLLDWIETISAVQNFQLVDFYGFLRPLYRIMPPWMSSYKRQLLELKEIEDRLFFKLLDEAKENIVNGKVYPSFVRDMLLEDEKDRMTDLEIACNAAHGFGAATDTQRNTLMGFIKAMVLYPEVQKQAQQELDRVVGTERLPEWDDRENLVYIRGVVEETLRWMPTTLTAAAPHCVTKDDTYDGYFIPKGSWIMINVWTLNHARAEQPRVFDPRRYLPEETAVEQNGINSDSNRRYHFTFGAGRRVCPGYHVAQRGLFIAISRLLWSFQFNRACDESGKFIEIDHDAVSPGVIVQPAPFKCTITVRDDNRRAVIMSAWEKAKESLDENGNFTEEFFQELTKKQR